MVINKSFARQSLKNESASVTYTLAVQYCLTEEFNGIMKQRITFGY